MLRGARGGLAERIQASRQRSAPRRACLRCRSRRVGDRAGEARTEERPSLAEPPSRRVRRPGTCRRPSDAGCRPRLDCASDLPHADRRRSRSSPSRAGRARRHISLPPCHRAPQWRCARPPVQAFRASRSPWSSSELRRHSRWDQELEPVAEEIDVSQVVEVDRRPSVQRDLPSHGQSRSGVQSRLAFEVGRGERRVGVRMTASPVPLDRGPPVQPQALSGEP